MSNDYSDLVFEGNIYIIPLQYVLYLEKIPKEKAIFVVMKDTTFDDDLGYWDNAPYLTGDELEQFEKCWIKYLKGKEKAGDKYDH
ncbi:MAG: hypothetical protein FH762_20130 [Firmicutes bacterium]|nr:hypothetical protein [Bacillota bacterium]